MKKNIHIVLALLLVLSLTFLFASVATADGEPLIYGMQRNTATIYGINPETGDISLMLDTELSASAIGPNGLAYDSEWDIIYWVTYYDNNPDQVKLCYWNKEATAYPWHLKVQDGLVGPGYYLPDGDPDEGVTCADFYDGKYYYIPNDTDDLYVVHISRTSNTYAEVTQIDIYEDISGENDYSWNFGGDIAVGNDGLIYGVGDATPNASGGPYHFFSVELDDSPSGFTFQMIDDDVHDFSLQLAFGSNGTLYGHESRDNGLFYAVKINNGDLSGAYPNSSTHLYTDCASGPRTTEIKVNIDIKPTSCPNPLNIKSKGVLPVAILGTEEFDVTQIDPASINLSFFGPGSDPFNPPIPPDEKKTAYEDVATPFEEDIIGCYNCTTEGPDGYMDLTLKFDKQAIVAALGEIEDGECLTLIFTGNLKEEFGGTAFAGHDVVRIINKDKNVGPPLAGVQGKGKGNK